MKLERITPILNVSNIEESFAWFEKIGWQKGWDWGEPPSFGGVCSGDVEIFLCENGQGSRGGPMPQFVGDDVNSFLSPSSANSNHRPSSNRIIHHSSLSLLLSRRSVNL
jgi:hypothetical protein